MHAWGDEWFQAHGHKLDEAISYCIKFWRKWGRIGSHGKEKYGTFRDHPYFYNAWWAIHELFKPGYVYYQWGKRAMQWDIRLGYVVKALRIHRLIQTYQTIIYNIPIQVMCKKYPEITDELVSHLDGYEFVKPGIFGNVDGQKIHDKYWTVIERN